MKGGAVKALHDSRNQSCKQLGQLVVILRSPFFRVHGVDAGDQLIIRRQGEAPLHARAL